MGVLKHRRTPHAYSCPKSFLVKLSRHLILTLGPVFCNSQTNKLQEISSIYSCNKQYGWEMENFLWQKVAQLQKLMKGF